MTMRIGFRLSIAAALLAWGGTTLAGEGGWQCWADAAERYNVPIDLLYSIARVETGNKGNLVSPKNKNGTYDIGLMQINSMHLPRLQKHGITEDKLLADPCLNLHVGASILSDAISRLGYTWMAIGAYNAGSPDKRKAYALKVYAMYDRITKERQAKAQREAGAITGERN